MNVYLLFLNLSFNEPLKHCNFIDMKFYFIFLLILTGLSLKHSVSFSQGTIFYDTVSNISNEGRFDKALADGKFIYISGNAFADSAYNRLPAVIKTDTSGKWIWTATDQENYGRFAGHSYYTGLYCDQTFKSADRLYTIAGAGRADNDFYAPSEIWSIADSTGILLWKLQAPNTKWLRLTDYDDTTMIAFGFFSANNYTYGTYYLINKLSGKIRFSKVLGSLSSNYTYDMSYFNLLVDDHKNILYTYYDSCKKFTDSYLTQLQWEKSFSPSPIKTVVQDSARYILMGKGRVAAVDTANGNVIWNTALIPGWIIGVQSGEADCIPAGYALKDSLLYITWRSLYVGSNSLIRGFTLTRFNKNDGSVRFNVAYDFKGVPADPVPNLNDRYDWPFALCLDANGNAYLTGTYDGSNYDDGNWGIMKINGLTGEKMYESTIVSDTTDRSNNILQGGRWIHYYAGKVFCVGNVSKISGREITRPLFVSFDTAAAYTERFRQAPAIGYRYPSSLDGAASFGLQKSLLFKKLGRSAIIEMRNQNNALLWSKTYNRANKFFVPQHILTLPDRSIAASMIIYAENRIVPIEKSRPDSLVFMRMDSLGNGLFRQSIALDAADSIRPASMYTDVFGRVNFVFLAKKMSLANGVVYAAYMLNGNASSLGVMGYANGYFSELPAGRLTGIQHYNADTAVSYYPNLANFISPSQLATDNSYPYYGPKLIQGFSKIYSVIKLPGNAYFVMGKSLNGKIRGAKYNHYLPVPQLWEKELNVEGSMLNADTSGSAIYCVAEKGNNNLLICKLDKTTGNISWSFERSIDPGVRAVSLNFKFDPVKNSFAVGGMFNDSSVSGIRKKSFLLVLDTLGNAVTDITMDGYGIGDTKISQVDVLQNGILYGGVVCDSTVGIAGFYNFSNLLSSPCSNNNYNYWTGAVDHNWENAGNWSCGQLPGVNTRVIINSGTIILNSSTTVYSITIMPGVNLTIAPNTTLTVLH